MRKIKWLALLLVMALLLTGCNGWNLEQWFGDLGAHLATPFSEMEYRRPDMEKMEQQKNECCEGAQTQTDVEALLEQIWAFFGSYNSFYTQYHLASIHYFRDMTDIYWEEEYSFCLEHIAQAEAAKEQVLYGLADSRLKEELEKDPSFGEGFFDSFEGESIWDETFSALISKEAALEDRYYELFAESREVPYYSDRFFEGYGAQMGELFVDLVEVRQEIAAYAGYQDYPSFAYDFYYYRDYSPQQAQNYLNEIQRELVMLYRLSTLRYSDSGMGAFCDQTETFSYVQDAAQKMGGTVRSAFQLLKTAGLYDLTYSKNKYGSSFELFLPDYYVPYVFVSPGAIQQDKLTFAHEFGHFCNDYASGGSMAGIDVAEFFSQGMEYLSLCYGENTGALEQFKLQDCLRIFVEQAAYAQFELAVYDLKGESLTAENVYALYGQIGRAYGFNAWNWDSRDFVLIGHFFTEPMYLISYVVSNDAAFQLYQMEKETSGTGLALMEKELATTQAGFLAFVEEAGLKSPFEAGRVAAVRKTLEEMLE